MGGIGGEWGGRRGGGQKDQKQGLLNKLLNKWLLSIYILLRRRIRGWVGKEKKEKAERGRGGWG